VLRPDVRVVKRGTYRKRELSHLIGQALRPLGEAFDVVVATPEGIERYGECFALVYYPALHEGRELYTA
jgi:hypothetical protein